MEFTNEQLTLMQTENAETKLTLEKEDVLKTFLLVQMHNQVVSLKDKVFGQTKTGLFKIESLNGSRDLDFANPDDWKAVEIKSIEFSLTAPNAWGGSNIDTYNTPLQIETISLLN
ncbi:MAG: hypothetical protein MRY83_12855 [Flavobacteriales bacterium]|nr:hypothetical protein [Flavobacteriales bacterium]